MLAHGFTTEMLVDLIRAGLATAKKAEHVVAGSRTFEVARGEHHRGGTARAIAD
jgi:hypothetical protein